MLLRSSSTPVLGSLISSISESPNHNHHHHHNQSEVQSHTTNKPPPPTIPHPHKKLSFHQSPSQNFTTLSCNSRGHQVGFRRAQSEGNLESLASTSSQIDEFSFSKPPPKFPCKAVNSTLQSIPSFSAYNTMGSYENDDSDNRNEEDEEEEEEEEEEQERIEFKKDGLWLNRSFVGQEKFEGEMKMAMRLNEAIGGDSQQMHLARGPGVNGILDIGYGSGGGSGGGGGGLNVGYGGDGGDSGGTDGGKNLEEYYKKMVEENPGNPLFLRNYAQFLYQTKGDLERAEEYYSRAILADSEDGEILSQYASIIWELHRDEDRAVSYFERAIQRASEDSHVHAAYANFLWQIEDKEEEQDDDSLKHQHVVSPLRHTVAMASVSASA